MDRIEPRHQLAQLSAPTVDCFLQRSTLLELGDEPRATFKRFSNVPRERGRSIPRRSFLFASAHEETMMACQATDVHVRGLRRSQRTSTTR
jgi:hypothetical protein